MPTLFDLHFKIHYCLLFELPQEAIETVRTYFHPTSMERLVENLINKSLECSGPNRKKIGALVKITYFANLQQVR
jgi:hypothetical protein